MKPIFGSIVFLLLLLTQCTPGGEEEAGPSATPPQPDDSNGDQRPDSGEETMPVVITVQVVPEVARHLHEGTSSEASAALVALVEELGVSLEPQHPGITDPMLMPFFTVEVEEEERAETVIVRLRESPAVEGAYVKPAAGLP